MSRIARRIVYIFTTHLDSDPLGVAPASTAESHSLMFSDTDPGVGVGSGFCVSHFTTCARVCVGDGRVSE